MHHSRLNPETYCRVCGERKTKSAVPGPEFDYWAVECGCTRGESEADLHRERIAEIRRRHGFDETCDDDSPAAEAELRLARTGGSMIDGNRDSLAWERAVSPPPRRRGVSV